MRIARHLAGEACLGPRDVGAFLLNWTASMLSVRTFLRDRAGQDAVEYALLLGLIAVLVVAAFPTVATGLQSILQKVSQQLKGATHF